MKFLSRSFIPFRFAAVVLAIVCLAAITRAANVGVGGYTNDFTAQPLAVDWATRSFGAAAGDITTIAGLTNAVQTNSAALITAQTTLNTGNPPANLAAATWSSTGGYLQTRPTQNAATLLMATFTNATGADSF